MADNSVTTEKIYELRNSANQRWMNASASQTRGTSSQNYSTIDWSITVGGSATYWCDTGPTSLWVGSERVYYLDRVLWSYGAFPVVPGTKSGSTKVYHNTDGSVSNLTISLTSAINTGAANSDTRTATLTMSSIARYFSSTPTISSTETTETSVKYNWSTSETCSQIVVKYKKATASSYTTYSTTSVSATSGSFTITGLSPGTKYNVYITAKRSDSGLTSDSGVNSPTTYSWPYIKSISTSQLTIGSTQTLTIYNPRGHTLAIYMKQDSVDATSSLFSQTGITTIKGDSATYSITPNEDALYNSIPSSKVGNAVYYCTSSGGGRQNYKSGTYTIKGSEIPTMPSSMFTFSEGNTTVSSIKPGGFVQLLSIVQGLVNSFPTVNNGAASITSCTATLGGVTYDVTGKNQIIEWSNLNISGSQVVDIVATDSRGLSNNTTLRVEYLPYRYPSLSATATRVNNYGEAVTLSTTYTVSTVNSTNQAKIYYSGASKTGYTLGSASALGSIASSGQGTTTVSLTGIDNNSSYTFNFTLTDRYGQTATASANLSRGVPIMFVDSAVLGVGVNRFPSISGLDVNGEIRGKNGINVGWITDYGSQTITVGGDADTYYPVIISNNNSSYDFPYLTFHISRGYSRTAPDTWYNSTHKGGLTLSFLWSGDGAWGGNYKTWKILAFNEQYTTMVAKMALLKRGMTVWLRGGGAYYRFHCDAGTRFSVTPYLDGFTDSDGVAYSSLTSVSSSDRATITNAIVSRRIDLWPVGSIYMSTADISPASFIGGTWTRLKDRFLLGYGDTYTSAGGTGGASTVTLTTTQIPSHTHTIPALSGTAASNGSHYHKVTGRTTTYASGVQSAWRCLSFADTSSDYDQSVYTGGRTSTSNAESAGAHTHSVTTTSKASESTGGGGSHNNMPPYKIVYMWERTA